MTHSFLSFYRETRIIVNKLHVELFDNRNMLYQNDIYSYHIGSGSMSLENFSPVWYLVENHQGAR